MGTIDELIAARIRVSSAAKEAAVSEQAGEGMNAQLTPQPKWNQRKEGNAWVSDGAQGFWASFPAGTSAQDVLDTYMATADYSAATGTFTVRAEIAGAVATVLVGAGGEVLS